MPHGCGISAAVQQAAAELHDGLEALYSTLAALVQPERVRYGRGRVGSAARRSSPKGVVVDPVNLKILLPDGRLWSYSRADAARFPAGRYYNARTDYGAFAGNRVFPGGREFVFLGAIIGKYSFGYAGADTPGRHRAHDSRDQVESTGLYALCGDDRSFRYLAAPDAFAAIASRYAESCGSRQTG